MQYNMQKNCEKLRATIKSDETAYKRAENCEVAHDFGFLNLVLLEHQGMSLIGWENSLCDLPESS